MSEAQKYTCEDAFNRLDDFLDRELTDEEIELVKQHLECCAHCAGAYTFEGDMLECMKSKIKHLDVPQNLLDKINKALDDAGSE